MHDNNGVDNTNARFMDKGSLHDLIHIKKVKIEIDRMLEIIFDITQAMVYLHKRKILHCDLKSSNILVSSKWTVKIADFGLSRIRDTSSNLDFI